MAKRRKIRPKARPKARNKTKQSPYFSPDFFPTGIGGPNNAFGGQFHVGGGMDEARLKMDQAIAASTAEQGRQGQAQGFLEYLTEIQQNPFSIVPALQAYGASGGGNLGPAAALAASGGRGQPSPYGDIADNLIRSLRDYTGGTDINPMTGMPYTALEMGGERKKAGVDAYKQWLTDQQKKKNAPKGNKGKKPKGKYLQGEYTGPNTPAVDAYKQFLENKRAGVTQ